MTEENQPAAFVENMLLLRREDFDELLERVAERGAERCLAHLGLENGSAAKDIHELRDLLDLHSALRPTHFCAICGRQLERSRLFWMLGVDDELGVSLPGAKQFLDEAVVVDRLT